MVTKRRLSRVLKLPTTVEKGGLRSTTGYSGLVEAVISVFIFSIFSMDRCCCNTNLTTTSTTTLTLCFCWCLSLSLSVSFLLWASFFHFSLGLQTLIPHTIEYIFTLLFVPLFFANTFSTKEK